MPELKVYKKLLDIVSVTKPSTADVNAEYTSEVVIKNLFSGPLTYRYKWVVTQADETKFERRSLLPSVIKKGEEKTISLKKKGKAEGTEHHKFDLSLFILQEPRIQDTEEWDVSIITKPVVAGKIISTQFSPV